ncbi:MAG TPA: hypothetical protein VKT18_01475, partial [Acidimicrobiales bacterium]|nr:hypothetical protein [Acidimicrobiales bacterium]
MSSWDEGVADGPQTLVHWFEAEGSWWVCAGDTSIRCGGRAEAFEAAKDLARQTTPSQLSSTAPE